jgi:hypothetical protein
MLPLRHTDDITSNFVQGTRSLPLMNEGLPDLRRSRDLRALTGRGNVRPLCLALNAAGVALEQLPWTFIRPVNPLVIGFKPTLGA